MDIIDYLKIPFKDRGRDDQGVDCYGLAHWFYKQEFGIDLPSYVEYYETDKDREAIAHQINHANLTGWMKSEQPEYGQLIILHIQGRPLHLGVMLDDKTFIHCMKNKGVSLENRDDITWTNRVGGFLKWLN